MVNVSENRFSPVWGWAIAGAVTFPALTFALGSQTTGPLSALAAGCAGLGVMLGASLAARGRGNRARESVRAWAFAYAAGALVYLAGNELSWPQPDNAVIVRPDGRGGLNGTQESLLLLCSIGLALLLGAALDQVHRAAPGRARKDAARAAGGWALALLPLPVLILYGLYGAAILATVIPVGGKAPAFVFGLICAGLTAGAVVGAIGECVVRRVHAR